MDNQSYTSTILVERSSASAFEAIKKFREWWSEDIEGETDRLNEIFFYHYKDIHLCKIKLIEEIPNQKLVYQIVDNQFSFVKSTTEWINTKLIFEIAEKDGKTQVKFKHEGLVPEYECYQICEDAWSNYIRKSLFDLIMTGKGQPNPKEKDGFNAEIVKKWKLK